MSNISDKAVVSPKAKIGENVTIYPFVYIEDNVEIGDNSIIYPNVSILNGTKMGSNNKVHQGTVLGAMPQDFNFRGEPSQLIIGNDNIFRENVVINRATHSTGQTVIGDNNFFMEGAHIPTIRRSANTAYSVMVRRLPEIARSAMVSYSLLLPFAILMSV